MSDYTYTREEVAGKYNIHFKGEDSKLHTEIETALPGKAVSKVKCNGTQVTIILTPTLTTPEKTILDTVVQDHKDNSATNIKDEASPSYNDISLIIKDSTSSSVYTISASFIFRGTNIMGVPVSIKVICDSGSGGDIKIYDVTNAKTICEKTEIIAAVPTIIDLGILSNLPSEESLFEIQFRKGASSININGLNVHF